MYPKVIPRVTDEAFEDGWRNLIVFGDNLQFLKVIYEDRPYRKSMDHNKAMKILNGMAEVGQLDHIIVADINSVF